MPSISHCPTRRRIAPQEPGGATRQDTAQSPTPQRMGTTMPIDRRDWLLLLLLSVLWGGSFFFTGVAVRELPPMTIVLARAGLGASLLVPVMLARGAPFPTGVAGWFPFLIMALLNNVVPFSLFVFGQTMIATGLASVLNATTPLFTLLVMAAFGEEALLPSRVIGVAVGFGGVAILRGESLKLAGPERLGVALCLAGGLSYGFAALWGRRKLTGVAPLTSATCQ